MSLYSEAPIQYARAGDVNIAYQVMGDGPVDIVYVPGMLNLIEATGEIPALERHYERFTAFSRIIVFDKRGTGLSDRVPPDDMGDMDLRVEDVRAVLDANQLEKAVVFGTADGAPVAMQFAARYPARVEALVLYAPSARFMRDAGYEIGRSPDRQPPLDVFREWWGNTDRPLSFEIVAPSVGDNAHWRDVYARLQRRAASPTAAYDYWQRLVISGDVREILPQISVPTLIMHCVGDALYPVAQGRFVAENIPGAKLVELAGTDHFPFFEHGDVVVNETEDFLTGSRTGHSSSQKVSTVLFTDLVGSTEAATRLGDARWRDVREDHDRLLQREVVRSGGRIVETTGDGVLAAFDDPVGAVQCALRACEAVRGLGLEMRAGLHTGLVELRGDGISGIAVNIAARALEVAGASEVIATRTVKDLLAGSSLRFHARGVHRFKGVQDDWEVFAAGS